VCQADNLTVEHGCCKWDLVSHHIHIPQIKEEKDTRQHDADDRTGHDSKDHRGTRHDQTENQSDPDTANEKYSRQRRTMSN
jgi:hypothetical protein